MNVIHAIITRVGRLKPKLKIKYNIGIHINVSVLGKIMKKVSFEEKKEKKRKEWNFIWFRIEFQHEQNPFGRSVNSIKLWFFRCDSKNGLSKHGITILIKIRVYRNRICFFHLTTDVIRKRNQLKLFSNGILLSFEQFLFHFWRINQFD